MNRSEKKKHIESIKSINALSSLIKELLVKIGYESPEAVEEGILEVKEKGKLRTRKIQFHLYLSEMNGKVHAVVNRINKNDPEVDEMYVITSHKKQSDYFKKFVHSETSLKDIEFWNQEKLVELIDDKYQDYWDVNDQFLKSYQEYFLNTRQKDTTLTTILQDDANLERLVNTFIEPKIFILSPNEDSGKMSKKRINIDSLSKEQNQNFILSGEAGTGKSTLLKEIGSRIIKQNEKKKKKKKTIPIYIGSSDLFKNGFSVEKSMLKTLSIVYDEVDHDHVFKNYSIRLLIDSIDEFEMEIREQILGEINDLFLNESISFGIATRNYESLLRNVEIADHINPFLTNFDQRQAKKYLDHFFKFDIIKSEKLWTTLSDNNILDKVPITALTISLISLLYEENEYEIPATVTDVYDNFNAFLLGRTNVKSNLEFLNINIKERILSLYALSILQKDNRERLHKDAFLLFVKEFFEQKSITVKDDILPEILDSLTDGTGILYVDENDFITYKHDQFMEYYASKEIFNYRRAELEDKLVEKFIDFNWQNTGVFYAGRTKDMPYFLEKVITRVDSYSKLNEYLLAISGLGYLLQSLWLTDSKIRKVGIKKALDLLLLADSKVKELAANKFPYFSEMREYQIAIYHLSWFFKHFNSITLRDPLNLAFSDIQSRLPSNSDLSSEQDKIGYLYQLFCIAATTNSGMIDDDTLINELFDNQGVLTIPLFLILFDYGLSVLEATNRKELNESTKLKNRYKRYNEAIRFYIDTPAEKLRLSGATAIRIPKDIEIFTEGMTDAQIIQHAHSVLHDFEEPKWNISACETKLGIKSGGANALSKLALQYGTVQQSDYEKLKKYIFLYDNDSKGHQEWNGISTELFKEENQILKKHINRNIFLLKLPIPNLEEFKPYCQEKQAFKSFEIEHYFPKSFLEDHEMISESPMEGVYEITGSKSNFSEKITSTRELDIFKNFEVLFDQIAALISSV